MATPLGNLKDLSHESMGETIIAIKTESKNGISNGPAILIPDTIMTKDAPTIKKRENDEVFSIIRVSFAKTTGYQVRGFFHDVLILINLNQPGALRYHIALSL